MNSYEGVLLEWQSNIVLSVMRQLRIPQSDRDDCFQEVAIHVLDFKADSPEFRESPEIVFSCFVRRKLFNIKRSDRRYKNHVAKSIVGRSDCVIDDSSESDAVDMINALPKDLQPVAKMLAKGFKPSKIAEIANLPVSVIKGYMKRIREKFEEQGY